MHGYAAVSDGTSSTVLVAENCGANASCADTNNDGTAEFVALTVPFRYSQSGERVHAAVVFEDGSSIDRDGAYRAQLHFDDRNLGSVEIMLVIDVDGHPGGFDHERR